MMDRKASVELHGGSRSYCNSLSKSSTSGFDIDWDIFGFKKKVEK